MSSFDTHGASHQVQSIVEESTLPARLRERIYRTVSERDSVSMDDVEQIVRTVEAHYEDTRVDPLEPVGTVSAQSIGEPGTQMSIDEDVEVIVRERGETKIVEIGPYVDGIVDTHESRNFDDHEVAIPPSDVEVLSFGSDEKVEWKTLEEVSRHSAPDELVKIELESGRTIRATKSHSFVTRLDNEVIPIAGADLEKGDWLPVIGQYEADGPTTVDLKNHLPSSEYWFTSAVADGGVTPASARQTERKLAQLENGRLESGTIYPVQGMVGIPEDFPLDEETGFLFGAWLAEGTSTDRHTSISNIDPSFRNRIHDIGERFGWNVKEYESSEGFGQTIDVRLSGKALADALATLCRDPNGNRRVPEFAFGAPDEFVRGLLSGYFSGDGNVGKHSIRASSRSHTLVTGVALLLARFGVYARFGDRTDQCTLRIPKKFVAPFAARIGMVGTRSEQLDELAATVESTDPDPTDQIPNIGSILKDAARDAGIPTREVNSAVSRQRIGRNRLDRLLDEFETSEVDSDLAPLRRGVEGDVVWERIESIEEITPQGDHVYDFSVAGLETFTTAQGIVTHNTMNTFHYAGVAEIDVTQGLPRLIEIVDARKTPDTPTMKVYLDAEYATERERAHEVIWKIEATRILALGDVSTNVADMRVQIDLNEETLAQRNITPDEIAERIEDELGIDTVHDGNFVEFGPEQPSYRRLLQLVEELREVVFKGIEDVSRVVVRKEETDEGTEEFVLYTEGSAFGEVLDIEGVDGSRTTSNNVHEVYRQLGVEAARESIINEMLDTLEEQALDDVNVRHLMLVADIMTSRGTIESIGRHGIAGSKESVLARAAYEVTVNHLLDAAIHGEVDDLNGVIENVIVGKPIKLGTGDVDLRMTSIRPDGGHDV